jgi:hypothetical protein
MLKLNPNPTFTWPVKFTSPEGEQTLQVVYRHMTVEEHDAWWAAAVKRYIDFRDALAKHADDVQAALSDGKPAPEAPKPERSGLDEVMDLVAGWQDVDTEFSRDALQKLMSNYHNLSAKLLCEEWSKGLTQRKLEN